MGTLNRIVLFACNQGGHFSQLMALNELFGKYESVLVTDNIRATKDMSTLKNVTSIEIIEGEAKQRKGQKRNSSGSRLKYRPKVIVSTGSNIAVPLFIIGKLYGSKIIFIETRAKVYTKSMTGILVRHMADQIFVQWPEMLTFYPEAKYCGVLV